MGAIRPPPFVLIKKTISTAATTATVTPIMSTWQTKVPAQTIAKAKQESPATGGNVVMEKPDTHVTNPEVIKKFSSRNVASAKSEKKTPVFISMQGDLYYS